MNLTNAIFGLVNEIGKQSYAANQPDPTKVQTAFNAFQMDFDNASSDDVGFNDGALKWAEGVHQKGIAATGAITSKLGLNVKESSLFQAQAGEYAARWHGSAIGKIREADNNQRIAAGWAPIDAQLNRASDLSFDASMALRSGDKAKASSLAAEATVASDTAKRYILEIKASDPGRWTDALVKKQMQVTDAAIGPKTASRVIKVDPALARARLLDRMDRFGIEDDELVKDLLALADEALKEMKTSNGILAAGTYNSIYNELTPIDAQLNRLTKQGGSVKEINEGIDGLKKLQSKLATELKAAVRLNGDQLDDKHKLALYEQSNHIQTLIKGYETMLSSPKATRGMSSDEIGYITLMEAELTLFGSVGPSGTSPQKIYSYTMDTLLPRLQKDHPEMWGEMLGKLWGTSGALINDSKAPTKNEGESVAILAKALFTPVINKGKDAKEASENAAIIGAIDTSVFIKDMAAQGKPVTKENVTEYLNTVFYAKAPSYLSSPDLPAIDAAAAFLIGKPTKYGKGGMNWSLDAAKNPMDVSSGNAGGRDDERLSKWELGPKALMEHGASYKYMDPAAKKSFEAVAEDAAEIFRRTTYGNMGEFLKEARLGTSLNGGYQVTATNKAGTETRYFTIISMGQEGNKPQWAWTATKSANGTRKEITPIPIDTKEELFNMWGK